MESMKDSAHDESDVALLEAKWLGLVIRQQQQRCNPSSSSAETSLCVQDFVDSIRTILNDNDDEGIVARWRHLGTTIRQQPRSGAALLADIVYIMAFKLQ